MPQNSIPCYPYGYDFGNAETVGVMFRQGIPYTHAHPSLSCLGSWESYQQKTTGASSDLQEMGQQKERGEYVLEYKGELFVGNLALKSRKALTTRNDVERYWKIDAINHLLVASGSAASDITREFQLDIVTGLPIEVATPENRAMMKQWLEENSPYIFEINGVQHILYVKVLGVVMEGAGALMHLSKKGPHKKAIIDIGGRTTNLFCVGADEKPVTDYCTSHPLGVEQIGDMVKEDFRKKYRYTLTPEDTRKIIFASIGKDTYPNLSHYGKDIPLQALQEWASNARSKIASDISSFIAQTWGNSEEGRAASDIKEIYCVGGGAYYFGEVLQKSIPHLTIAKGPEYANAHGYAEIAKVLQARNAEAQSYPAQRRTQAS